MRNEQQEPRGSAQTKQAAVAAEIKAFLADDRGDMAEKGVVLAVIILAALAMWQALGAKISGWVSRVAGAYT